MYFIKDLFKGFRKKQMTVIQSLGLGGVVGFPGSKLEYINDGYSGSSTVYSVVQIISETFATAPKVLYKIKNQKAFDKYRLLTKSYNSSLIDVIRTKAQAFDEVDSHPLLDLLNKPNDLEGAFDFLVHLNASRDITGDTFLWVNRGLTNGDPLDIKILPAQYMNLKISNAWTVEGYRLNIGKITDFTTDEVLHWKHNNLDFDVNGLHLFGQSPLKSLSKDYTLTANKEGKKSAAKGYKNMGAGGLLSRNEDVIWTEEQRDGLNEYLDAIVNGSDNRLKVRAANAKLNWVQLTQSANDQQIFEGIAVTKEDICNAYNFPVHILMASKGTFSNVDAANKYLVQKTVYSRWVSWRDFVNAKLLPMFKDGASYYYDFDISMFPEMQDDRKKLVEILQSSYWITPEEKREIDGWDASNEPLMKKFYFPTTVQPLDQMNQDLGGSIQQSLDAVNNAGVKDYKD